VQNKPNVKIDKMPQQLDAFKRATQIAQNEANSANSEMAANSSQKGSYNLRPRNSGFENKANYGGNEHCFALPHRVYCPLDIGLGLALEMILSNSSW